MLNSLKARALGLKVAAVTALVFAIPASEAMAGFRFP